MKEEVKHVRVLSLGAGVQSSTMALMAAHGEIERPDYIIFSDTGWEPQKVYDWLEWLKAKLAEFGMEVVIARKGNIRVDLLDAARGGEGRFVSIPYFIKNPDGSQGMGRRQCTREYKVEVVQKKMRELLGYEKGQRVKEHQVHLMLGISLDEDQRMSEARDAWVTNEYPLIEAGMTRYDCLEWMSQHGYPAPPKSSCVCCPYRRNKEWERMRREDPEAWAEAVEFDKIIRHTPGYIGEAYLHRSLKPLDEVDLSEQLELDLDMYRFDCAGMCAV